MTLTVVSLQQAAVGGRLPGPGQARRKPARNCLERTAALQVIAVLIAACALVRLMLACYAESGLVRLLDERRVLPSLPEDRCNSSWHMSYCGLLI